MRVFTPITDPSQLPDCFGRPELQPGCVEKCLIWSACVRFCQIQDSVRSYLGKDDEDTGLHKT